MKVLRRMMLSLARDERGTELMEYVLIAGLVIVVAIAAIASVGTKVTGMFDDSAQKFSGGVGGGE